MRRPRSAAGQRRQGAAASSGSAASRRSARSAGSAPATARRTASCRARSCRTSCGRSSRSARSTTSAIVNVFHAGDGNIHPILLFDERDPEQVQRVLTASNEILDECLACGGSVTGEHGIGVEKIAFMAKMFTATIWPRWSRFATPSTPTADSAPTRCCPPPAAAAWSRSTRAGGRRCNTCVQSDSSVGNALRGVPEVPIDLDTSTRPTERHRGRSLQMASTPLPFTKTERPQSADELLAVVRSCIASRTPLYPIGGGTASTSACRQKRRETACRLRGSTRHRLSGPRHDGHRRGGHPRGRVAEAAGDRGAAVADRRAAGRAGDDRRRDRDQLERPAALSARARSATT